MAKSFFIDDATKLFPYPIRYTPYPSACSFTQNTLRYCPKEKPLKIRPLLDELRESKTKTFRQVKLLNKWFDTLKSQDSQALRFILANLQLIPKLFSGRFPLTIAVGLRYHLNVPIVESSTQYAKSVDIDLSWKENTDSICVTGNPADREEHVRIISLMRTMTIGRLMRQLQRLNLRPSDLYEIIAYADQHRRSYASGTILTFKRPQDVERYGRDTFCLTMTAKRGARTRIELSQAATSARKTDGMPLMRSGTRLLVTELHP